MSDALREELARAREEADQSARELAALRRVSAALTNVTDLRASLTLAARELTSVFATRGSTVTLIDESGSRASVVAEYFTDSSLPSVIGLTIPLDTPAWIRLDRERTAIIFDNPQEDVRLGELRDVMRSRSVSQLLVAPLISRNQLVGNMSVSHEPGRRFAPNEIRLAEIVAAPLAQAVEIARLFEAARKEIAVKRRAETDLAAKNEELLRVSRELERANEELARLLVTDVVTAIPNRRRFHEVMDSEWRRSHRSGDPLAVLMIDVDFFKQFNDRHGHQAGDACLAAVAEALRSGLKRAGDFVARYGGEEFVVILPATDAATARAHGERLCGQIRQLAIPHGGSPLAPHVTVSVGCAAALPSAGGTPEALVALADQALYEAKRRGRDRVVAGDEL